jgi:hypothetical protein
MPSSTFPRGEARQWRFILFRIVSGLLALLVLYGGIRDLLLLSGQSGFPSVIHRWHEGQAGALMVIVFGGSLLALLWRPLSKPLLAQFLVLSIGILSFAFATVSGAGFNPIALAIGGVLIGILLAAYPRSRDLLNVGQEESLSYPLLAITIITAIFLAPSIARELNYQILGMTEHDVHAQYYHWLTSVILSLLLILAGSLAATKRPGWRVLTCITGIAFLYLGSAAFMLPDYAGSWGTIGGILGVVGGLGYIVITLLEARKSKRVIGSKTADLVSTSS